MTRATRAQHDFDCQQGVDIENLRIPGAHVCLIYDDDEERQEVVLRFIEAGIRAGERVGSQVVRNPYYVETAEFLALRGLPA